MVKYYLKQTLLLDKHSLCLILQSKDREGEKGEGCSFDVAV